MHTGNNDHERWDNRPSTNIAPKLEKAMYSDKKNASDAKIVVTVALVIIVAIAALALWDRLHPAFR